MLRALSLLILQGLPLIRRILASIAVVIIGCFKTPERVLRLLGLEVSLTLAAKLPLDFLLGCNGIHATPNEPYLAPQKTCFVKPSKTTTAQIQITFGVFASSWRVGSEQD